MELQLSFVLGLLGVQVSEVSQESLSLGGLCGFGAGPSFVGSSRGERSWVWVAKGLPPSSGGGGIIAATAFSHPSIAASSDASILYVLRVLRL